MSAVIQIRASAISSELLPGVVYLHDFDFDARDGRGKGVFTPDMAAAMLFENAGEAMTFWRTQSTVRPLRPDGKPNRPLTAYTVEIVTL